MGMMQRLGDEGHDLGRFPEGGSSLLEPLREVAPRNVPGDQVAEPAARPAHVVHRDDIGMVKPGQISGLGKVGLDLHGPTIRSRLGSFSATARPSSSSRAR